MGGVTGLIGAQPRLGGHGRGSTSWPSTSSTPLLIVFLIYIGIVIGTRKGEWFEPARIIAAFKDS